jgi:DNA-binding CsgD family transcriptional regulator/tetratricopeptide (TPR) repeat protein
LLGEAERTLFRHLSVFVDGFDIDAASHVAMVPKGDILHQLSVLVEQSLVYRSLEMATDERFALLETTREFATAQLSREAELADARRRHAAYFLDFAERMESGIYGPEMRSRLERLAIEYPNCRAALEYFIESDDVNSELWLAAMLSEYWCFRGHITEGIVSLERAIAHAGKTQPSVLAKAMAELAFLYRVIAENEAARSLSEAAVPLARQGDDVYRLSQVLFIRAYTLADAAGSQEEVIAILQEAIALVQEIQPPVETYPSLVADLGWALMRAGHPEQGMELVERALQIFRTGQRHLELGWTHLRLGRIAANDEQNSLAARLYAESLRSFRDAGMVTQIGYPLSELWRLLNGCGYRDVAAQFTRTIREISEQTGAKFDHEPVGPPLPRDVASVFASRTYRLSDAGPPLPFRDAIAAAIAAAEALASGKIPAGGTPSTPAVTLSDREREVLTFLAQRYTAPEIGEELFISVRTVERHIANIYNKLGVNSRRAAAAFAIRHGLI